MAADDLTSRLNRWSTAGPDKLDAVIDLVFDDLRALARSRLASGPPNLTLQPTELVHEVYMRLHRTQTYGFEDRSRFFALASKMIRTILVDAARQRSAAKRGRALAATLIAELDEPKIELDLDRALAIDQALKRLEGTHPRQSRVVELRLFGGLTMHEIADVTSSSQPTVERDWRLGRRRLARELRGL